MGRVTRDTSHNHWLSLEFVTSSSSYGVRDTRRSSYGVRDTSLEFVIWSSWHETRATIIDWVSVIDKTHSLIESRHVSHMCDTSHGAPCYTRASITDWVSSRMSRVTYVTTYVVSRVSSSWYGVRDTRHDWQDSFTHWVSSRVTHVWHVSWGSMLHTRLNHWLSLVTYVTSHVCHYICRNELSMSRTPYKSSTCVLTNSIVSSTHHVCHESQSLTRLIQSRLIESRHVSHMCDTSHGAPCHTRATIIDWVSVIDKTHSLIESRHVSHMCDKSHGARCYTRASITDWVSSRRAITLMIETHHK